jgi:hypothetical protein
MHTPARKSPTIFALSLAFASFAAAQNTGSLRGIVTDPSNSLIPEAKVAATGNNISRTATTDGQGRYSLSNLPPGKYSIRADAAGFVTFTRADVEVASAQPASLDIALQIAADTQQVSVNEQSNTTLSTDSSSNVGALVLNDNDLDALPDDPDDLQADLTALAGPGAGPNGPDFFVDGFSGGQLPPKSSIREIRISSNPFSSEYDRPGFGRVEILTKPGTDKLHGQVFMNYGNKVFDSRNPFLTTEPPAYSSKLFNGNVGGPLGKKASYFFEFNKRNIEENALIDAQTPAGNQVSAVLTPNTQWSVNPRLDYQINNSNTLVVRYSHSGNTSVGGVGGFNLASQLTNGSGTNNQVQITETAIIGTKAVDETRFQFRDNTSITTGIGNAAIPRIVVSSAFTDGGSSFASNTNGNKGYEIQNILTMTEGTHAVKVGFRVRETDLSTLSTSNFNGTWSFNAPFVLNGGTSTCPGAATSLDLYRLTQAGVAGCGPSQFTLSSGTPSASASQFDMGVFVQDDWRIKPNLTLNAGLRLETQNNISDHMDWAPRVGLAWAPGGKGKTPSKTVFRAGYGFFYDRFNESNFLQTLRFNGVTQTNYLITSGPALSYYPNVPPVSLLSVQNQAVYTVDRNIRSPYNAQLALGMDRQLPGRTQVAINFVDTRGVHVLRTRNINAPQPGTYTGLGTGTRPFPGGDLYQYEDSGIYKETQLTVNANTRVNSHVQVQGYYSYGDAHSNANGFLMNQYDASLDWGRANFDQRHRGFIGGNIGLPLRLTVAPFVTMQSGSPFNITTGNQFNGDGIYNARPSFAPCTSTNRTRFGCFNLNPAPGDKLIPVNYGDGPSEFSVNLRVSRTWGWGERNGGGGGGGGGFQGPPGGGFPGGGGGNRGGGGGFQGGFAGFGGGNTSKRYNLTLNVQARNAFNHVNLAAPSGNLTSTFFGQSTALGGGGNNFNGGNGAAGNRKIEIQLRFQF